jgi:hypothetical protein
MKPIIAGFVAALCSVLFLSGCAQPIGGEGKSNYLKLVLADKLDRDLMLKVTVGEFAGVTKSEDGKRNIALNTRKEVMIQRTIVIPAGKTAAEIPFQIDSKSLVGRQFIVLAVEQNPAKGLAPIVGAASFQADQFNDFSPELSIKGGIHIPPRPRPRH